MKRLFLALALFLICVSVLLPQIPKTLNYQGLLTNASGQIVPDGSYSLVFNLYESASGGAVIWSESQSVNIAAGMLNVVLGNITPLSLPFDKPYYLGISVNSEAELSPRLPLSSSPYAIGVFDINNGKITNSQINSSTIGETTPSSGKFSELKIGAQKINKFSTDATLAGNSDETLVTEKALKAYIDALAIPPGTIMAYGGTTAPPGWLLCDGAAVSRDTYSKLYAAISTAFGTGDGTTTFNVPDMRGRFLRGVDGSAGRDPDTNYRTVSGLGFKNAVGSVQEDQFKSHDHEIKTKQTPNNLTDSNGFPRGSALVATPNLRTQFSGGNETRPKNIYVNFIIKY